MGGGAGGHNVNMTLAGCIAVCCAAAEVAFFVFTMLRCDTGGWDGGG